MTEALPPGSHLRRLAFGFMTTYTVRAALQLKLVDAFDDAPRTGAEVAAALGLPAETVTRLLRALTVLGLFTEPETGRFAVTGEGHLLGQGHPGAQSALVEMFTDPVMTRGWEGMAESVRTGRPAFDDVFGKPFFAHLAEDPAKSALFNASMSEGSRAVARILPQAFDFGRFASVTDVGGGDGTLLTEILQAHPSVRGAVFDSAEGGAAATGRFEAAGLADRTSVLAGDFFAEVPDGSDVYLLKSIIHDWDDDRCATILRHCRAVMPPDGRLLLVEPVLPEVVRPGTPPGLYLSDLNMLVNVGGRERTRTDFENLCYRANLEATDARPLGDTGFWLIEAIPAP
ncbi:methyltransferase [Amycolatopsis sp. lyj-90]|uniref:methyltransferase n=1 Tax=Amycolatopsis sp. lyj-90 TaxID=2789285 RepID=UPI00397C747F